MANYDPPVAFSFRVSIKNGTTAAGPDFISFSEMSGLEAAGPISELQEGGENRLVHRLPSSHGFQTLVCKRGTMPAGSDFAKWCRDVIEGALAGTTTTHDLSVSLLDANGTEQITWAAHNAWPVKWAVASLRSEAREIAVETLEFAYQNLTRTSPSGQPPTHRQ